MNVFEFLGLPANHRTKEKVVQRVKNFEEVPDSRKQYPYLAQVKKDGVFAMLVSYQGKQAVFSRTGEMFTSTQVILKNAEIHMLQDGVFFGEMLSHHKCSLEQLSGTVNPNRVNPLDEMQLEIAAGLYIAWHDFLPIGSFKNGTAEANYRIRYLRLEMEMEHLCLKQDILPITLIHDEAAKDKFTKACIAAGEEGAVYKHLDAGWVAGHKGWHMMKEVRGIHYDLKCINWEEGKGKYAGKVANLVFAFRDGKTVTAMLGKGWTHEDARQMYLTIQGNMFMLNPLGQIFHVYGLQDSSKGKIRNLKVGELRIDKQEADF